MTEIYCLVGASGSGKTTLAKEMHKKGYNVIQSYTTRKPRFKNEWGHTFIDAELSNCNTHLETSIGKIYATDMIAYFNNYNNIYFATYDQIKEKEVNFYVVDPRGAIEVIQYFKLDANTQVYVVYLDSSEATRKERLEKRTEMGADKKDIPYRLTKDREIFRNVEYDFKLDANMDIEYVVHQIELILQTGERGIK